MGLSSLTEPDSHTKKPGYEASASLAMPETRFKPDYSLYTCSNKYRLMSIHIQCNVHAPHACQGLSLTCLGQKHLGQAKLNQTIKVRFGRLIKGVQSIVQSTVTRYQGDLQTAKNQEHTAAICCHGNFGPAKILVWGNKIPGKFGPPDYYFQKMLVCAWNNGPSANTSV